MKNSEQLPGYAHSSNIGSEISGGGRKKKRKLSSWNLFVMDLKKKNPTKTFKDVLKMASKLKKKGMNTVKFAKKVGKKTLTKLSKRVKKRKTSKRKTGKK
tara:strand:- start:547 stop:846 length:300 start_codon:yes stop_codon:yes gene_type:complete